MPKTKQRTTPRPRAAKKEPRVLTVRELRKLISAAWKGKMTAVEAVREQRDKPYYH